MENASKALIIAGAILISILLITVGVLIMNSTDSVTGQTKNQAEVMAIKMFNSQFTPFAGEGQTASQIRSLVSTVKASNAKYPDNQITSENFSVPDTLNAKYKYNVSIEYDDGGYIYKITVTQEKSN